ncbi:type II toxin-antitoxin system RelE/ParE family toxin [uncultured Oscillibacter sp.]|jgi:hypothetical protein|uniref:type II toxin-antitoxin system RelE/ParE family toxin n=1 Tax=uncultured Oscillibacter sp. TaxID=876091 RepID=UPI002606899F|nr:type II toxin-antitoxin system RelE/ParE family toxin [uncultured Oscillibacter sp.]
MNRRDILARLWEAFDGIDIHPSMIAELMELIAESGAEQQFLKLLLSRLKYLKANGARAVSHEEFESIRDGIFSMHLSKRDFNIRILYTFLPNRNPCLLLCFYERAGKQATDYTKKIPIALKRFSEELEGYKNGEK